VTARGKRRGRRATASRARARGRSARRAVDAATLMEAAERARSRAHAPYSHFTVGAALLTRRGTIVTGCNVENASYGLTICAERVAVFNAATRSPPASGISSRLPWPRARPRRRAERAVRCWASSRHVSTCISGAPAGGS